MPLRDAEGGPEFLARIDAVALEPFGATAPLGPLELVLPTPEDMDDIVDLVYTSFDRLFEKKRMPADSWFAGPINAMRRGPERREVEQGLRFRLDLQFPSLRRPVHQDLSLAVLARPLQSGTPAAPLAYFELCVLPADGRRPEDLGAPPELSDARPAPYFSNLCVAEECRQRGLGRAMLRLAEDIVALAWGDEYVYLHIDDYVPSQRLYGSAGYTPVRPPLEDGMVHMRRRVRKEIEEEGLVDVEEADEEEAEELEVIEGARELWEPDPEAVQLEQEEAVEGGSEASEGAEEVLEPDGSEAVGREQES